MSPQKKRQECIVYSRCCGWLSPVKNWNKGKISEYNDRKVFEIKKE